MTTGFVGDHTEWVVGAANQPARYYNAGGMRLATRVAGVMYYPLTDHLGSTGMTTDANGYEVAEIRYKAWGESRYTWNTTPTRHTYTGQYSNASDFGLMYYNARWYDPALSRFSSADTIVPQPGNPSSYDRFSYVFNNPIRNIDPSGHRACSGMDEYGNCVRDPDWQPGEEINTSTDISLVPQLIQENIPPFDASLGGNHSSDHGDQSIKNNPSVIALVLIGIPLSLTIVIADIALVGGEIALISSSLAVPATTPLTVPLGLILAGTGIGLTYLDYCYWVYTLQVANAPKGEPVEFEFISPWVVGK